MLIFYNFLQFGPGFLQQVFNHQYLYQKYIKLERNNFFTRNRRETPMTKLNNIINKSFEETHARSYQPGLPEYMVERSASVENKSNRTNLNILTETTCSKYPLRIGCLKQVNIKSLFRAKCLDLKIESKPQLMERFFEYCKLHIKGTKIILREIGLGKNSAKVIAQLLETMPISSLDLRNNYLGSEGLRILI